MVDHNAVPLAGGSAIVALMRQRVFSPSHLVSLHRIPDLDAISSNEDGGLSIGAMATLRLIECQPEVRQRYPLLAETLSHVANVRVRGSATLGGNLAHGDYRLDPPAALMALGAEIRLGSSRGERSLRMDDFFHGFFQTAKEEDEIVIGIVLPPSPARASSYYLKFTSHASVGWPCVGVAVSLSWDDSGRCGGGAVVLSAAAERPLRVEGTDDILKGERVTERVARKVGEMAAGQIDPVDDASGSAWYKREIIPALVRRALLESAFRAGGGRKT